MKQVLVTGGLGFLGSHLVDRLLEQGHHVTIVDSCISNVMQPEHYKQCEVIVEPIERCGDRFMRPHHSQFHEIYHLASVVGPAGLLKHAGDIAPTTVMGSEMTAQLALSHGARLILVSTSEVYGQGGKFTELDRMVVPAQFSIRLEYAVAKLTSEVSVLNRARVTNLAVNVVRPFNISGPRQLHQGGFVLPRFVVAALLGEPITVYGTGKQVRAFTDVRDMVTGLVAVMESKAKGEVFNLGNAANEIAIEDFAQRVKRISGSSSDIVHVDPKQLFGPLFEDGFDKVPDSTKMIQNLGWKLQYNLEATIADTVQWYRDNPSRLISLRTKLPAAV